MSFMLSHCLIEDVFRAHSICFKDIKSAVVVWVTSCWYLITAPLFVVPLASSTSMEHISSQTISSLRERFCIVPIMILVTVFCAPRDELIIFIILNDHIALLIVISLQFRVPELLFSHVAERIAALIDSGLYSLISSTNQWMFQHLELRAHKSSLASESRPSVCCSTLALLQ